MSVTYDLSAQVDQPLVNEMQKKFTTTMNLNSEGAINLPENNTFLNSKTYPGFKFDDKLKLTNTIKTLEDVHNYNTEANTVINSLFNMNNFITGTHSSESKRIQNLNSKSMNDLYKIKQEFMQVKNRTALNNYYSGILKLTIITMVICGLLAIATQTEPPRIALKTAIIACSCVGLLYIIIIIIMNKNMHRRRNDDWTKFYFNEPKKDI
jgi:hypothetical protein